MVTVRYINISDDALDMTVKLRRVDGTNAEMLRIILASIIANFFGNDINIDSEWIQEVCSELHKPGHIIVKYVIRYSQGNLAIGAVYRERRKRRARRLKG
jgi:hypothetical protein